MYSNGGGIGIRVRKTLLEKIWRQDESDHGDPVGNKKGFARCICPKCTEHHYVRMLWTGRGVPRKYCQNCKPLVSAFDDAALNAAKVCIPGNAANKGRPPYEGD